VRFSTDTGGTFTDLVIEDDDGGWRIYKAATVAADPVKGVLDALSIAAADHGVTLAQLLARGSTFVHATTHAINAVLTGNTAKTALLTTQGHPDILLLREGGRPDPFDFRIPFPQPYIPRRLVYEIPERIDADGAVYKPLDEAAVVAALQRLATDGVEAIAVCLLWSIVNGDHERRIGALIEQHLPGVPYTLSHTLNPAPREFRRASASAIDASLKPLMGVYLGSLTTRLQDAGFTGRVLVVTSQGGVMDAAEVAKAPIHVINSGPSMAPVAGRSYAALDAPDQAPPGDVIIADTGGTTFDVSTVRAGRIPLTRELWIGAPITGHLTGFPSVDVRSVGAGGGSIAHVDQGGVLHVGPQSAGATPGPACYGRGGSKATLTDAALILGYLDPAFFLGGSMQIDADAANRVLSDLGADLGLSPPLAAASVIELATETMTQAILDITVKQGVDPQAATLIGGGGAAGLNLIFIARRLGCARVMVPETGATLSAAGALISDLTTDRRATLYMSTERFDMANANTVLSALTEQCRRFADEAGDGAPVTYTQTVEARYADQAWEIEVELPAPYFASDDDVARFRRAFDIEHERLYAFTDPGSAVEIVSWRVAAACRIGRAAPGRLAIAKSRPHPAQPRQIVMPSGVSHLAPVYDWADLEQGRGYFGPAIVESPFTTVVIDEARFQRTVAGSLLMELV
jgi:N-methylhydantoinase A